MAVDERAWIQLQKSLERTLGADSAVTLMTLLPPTGWADVATPHDVRAVRGDVEVVRSQMGALEERMDARFDVLEGRFEARFDVLEGRFEARFDVLEGSLGVLEGRFEAFDERLELTEHRLTAAFRGELLSAVSSQTRTVVFALCGTAVSMAGLALAFARAL